MKLKSETELYLNDLVKIMKSEKVVDEVNTVINLYESYVDNIKEEYPKIKNNPITIGMMALYRIKDYYNVNIIR